jgi:hypothetical protein
MDEIEVTARFDPNGKIFPLNFIWRTRRYKVSAVGRQWDGADGRHILVMDIINQTYHLVFKPETSQWFLFHGGSNPDSPRV